MGEGTRDDRRTPGLRAWAGSLLAMMGVYRLLAGTGEWAEWVAGASAAAAGTTALMAVAAEVSPFRPGAGSLGFLVRLPGRAAADCLRVLRALARALATGRALAGAWVEVPFDAGGDDPASAARRALVLGAGSLPPNTLMVAIEPEAGRLLAHRLVPAAGLPGGGGRGWPR